MASSVASSITSNQSPIRHNIFIANMPPKTDDRLPALIRDELRRAVALYCLDIIFQKDSMKVAQMRKIMFDLYHGNELLRVISHVQMLWNGEQIFEELFEDRHDNVVNRT